MRQDSAEYRKIANILAVAAIRLMELIGARSLILSTLTNSSASARQMHRSSALTIAGNLKWTASQFQ